MVKTKAFPLMNNKQGEDIFTWDNVSLALDAAREGLYVWDISTGRIHYTNQSLVLLGCKTNKGAPNIFTQTELVIHEEDRPFFEQEVRRYLEHHSNVPMNIEVRFLKRHSQEWCWVRVTGLVKRNKEKEVTGLVGAIVNISRRKTAELRATEERELFRALIDHIPNNIFVKNRDSRFIMANHATAKKMGISVPSDIIGRSDADFFEPSMASISRREELDIMSSKKPLIGAIHHEMWLDGADSWVMVSKFPWIGSNGILKGIVGITSDVTKLVKAEKEVRKTAKILQERNDTLEKEINLAREIQLSLLPYELPSQKFEIDGKIRQASSHHIFAPSEGVAGDWFGVELVGSHGYGAIVCDVMGHGIRAALIASMLRGLIVQFTHLGDNPEALLAALNKQLSRILNHANVTMFASAIYMYLDLKDHKLSICSAGHPAPVLVSPDGAASQLTLPKGIAMGLMENAVYKNADFQIEPDTKILLYTDGLTEATDKTGDELGVERVMQYMGSNPKQNAKDFVLSVLRCAAKFTGYTNLSDDLCLLGVHYTETEKS